MLEQIIVMPPPDTSVALAVHGAVELEALNVVGDATTNVALAVHGAVELEAVMVVDWSGPSPTTAPVIVSVE